MENNISVKVVAHSINRVYTEMLSIEVEMPRSILAELNTHKILVRNSASSRAIPIKTMVENIETGKTRFTPLYIGKNKSGMSASEKLDDENVKNALDIISILEEYTLSCVEELDGEGVHKQIAGRYLEPFSMVKIVLSGTEWDNFFNLRIHKAAEPHFRDLAIKIYKAKRDSIPFVLYEDEWHLPYIHRHRTENGIEYSDSEGNLLTTEEAIRISLSCVAQTSYRKHDETLDKADDILGKLFNGDVVHASPAEHIATPMKTNSIVGCWEFEPKKWQQGVTHVTRDGYLWSAQLRGFIQYRQLIPNNVCERFTEEKFLEYTKDEII